MEYKDPGRYIPLIYLLYSWFGGSLYYCTPEPQPVQLACSTRWFSSLGHHKQVWSLGIKVEDLEVLDLIGTV